MNPGTQHGGPVRRPSFPSGRQRCLLAAAAALPGLAAAEETLAPGVSSGSILQTLVTLILIVALFVGAAWLMRRVNGGRGMFGQGGLLRVVGGIAIGTRERIVVVEIEDTWLVIGITPGQMRTLHTLPKGSAMPPAPGGENQFGQWLKQFKERGNDQPR